MKKIFYTLMAIAISAFTLQSCEDVPAPYDIPNIAGGGGSGDTPAAEATGTGTADDPYNVAKANTVCATLEKSSTSASYYSDAVYVKGKVSQIADTEFNSSYGNITFYISDTGETTSQLEAYRCMGLGGAKFKSLEDIKVGDEVIIYGKLQNWLGTYEFTQGCQLYSLNGQTAGGGGSTAEATGTGTEADPYNVAKANNVCAALQKSSTSASYLSDEVYIKGKISTITDTELSSYGNITYYISDDGSTTEQLEVYRGLSFNGAKFTAISDIKVGDEVVVKGKLQNWLGTYELTQGSALVSLNGKSGGTSGGGDTPTAGEAKGTGTQADPFNIAAAIKKCQETGETATTDQYYVKGNVKSVDDSGIATYGNINIDLVDNGSTTVFKAFQIYSFNGEKFTGSASGIKAGDEVVVKGNLVNYKSNTPETTGKGTACLVTVNGKTEITTGGGGESGGSQTSSDAISISGTTLTLTNTAVAAGTETVVMTVNDLGIADKGSAVGTYKFSDGTTLTIEKGEGSIAPTYYASSNGFRIYASNVLKFEGTKTIAKIVMECDSYSGTDYVGNKTATFTVSGKTATYNNYFAGNKGGVQLRAKKITIYYASASSAKRTGRRR